MLPSYIEGFTSFLEEHGVTLIESGDVTDIDINDNENEVFTQKMAKIIL